MEAVIGVTILVLGALFGMIVMLLWAWVGLRYSQRKGSKLSLQERKFNRGTAERMLANVQGHVLVSFKVYENWEGSICELTFDNGYTYIQEAPHGFLGYGLIHPDQQEALKEAR